MAHLRPAGLSRVGLALFVLCASAPAWSAANDAGNPGKDFPARAGQATFDFDMPAQPLGDALDSYAALTQRPALFSSDMVSGRVSSPVHGKYSPAVALQLLLEGTGIAAGQSRYGPAEAFVLRVQRAPAPVPPVSPVFAGAGEYPGLAQARLWDALCNDARTVPGAYRALIRFRVDADGRVHDAGLIHSTGDRGRDAALLAVFQRTHMEAPPPQDMPQPLLMIVLPRSADNVDAGMRCERGTDFPHPAMTGYGTVH